MLRAERVTVVLDLVSLWSGPLRVRGLEIENARLVLEADGEGRGNWLFARAPEPDRPSASPGQMSVDIDRAAIRGLELVYRPRPEAAPVTLAVAELAARLDPATRRIELDGSGRFEDSAVGDRGPARHAGAAPRRARHRGRPHRPPRRDEDRASRNGARSARFRGTRPRGEPGRPRHRGGIAAVRLAFAARRRFRAPRPSRPGAGRHRRRPPGHRRRGQRESARDRELARGARPARSGPRGRGSGRRGGRRLDRRAGSAGASVRSRGPPAARGRAALPRGCAGPRRIDRAHRRGGGRFAAALRRHGPRCSGCGRRPLGALAADPSASSCGAVRGCGALFAPRRRPGARRRRVAPARRADPGRR